MSKAKQARTKAPKGPKSKPSITHVLLVGLLIVTVVLVGLGLGFKGFVMFKQRSALATNKRELATYEASIRAALQEHVDTECYKSGHGTLFNFTTITSKAKGGSVEKRYGVVQFTCEDDLINPPRFAAVQSYDNGQKWEFIYGAGTASPRVLPAYIYDTNPYLFKKIYDNPIRE